MDRDLINGLNQGRVPSAGAAAPGIGLVPVKVTATQLSSSIDLAGYHGAVVALLIGAFGDVQSGTIYMEGELQESNDDSTYTAVADADLLFPPSDAARAGTAVGTFFQSKTTAAHDLSGIYTVGYRGNKRYLKCNLRLTGTHSTGTPVAVLMTAGFPDYAPVSGNAS